MYYLYIVTCADGSLYTGVTTDVKRRIEEHNASKRGSRYTRARRPVILVYSKKCKTRALAQVEEAHIKKLSRVEKMKLIQPSR
ncbi:MAG: GIY-YIG nuclease family protein [Candidatus Magasanikbacteria bacterium]